MSDLVAMFGSLLLASPMFLWLLNVISLKSGIIGTFVLFGILFLPAVGILIYEDYQDYLEGK